MGLDGIEILMEVEDAFHIAIADEDAERMRTPRDLVNYVLHRLGSEGHCVCLEQRAFFRLRRAAVRVFAQPRDAIKPGTRWETILPLRQLRHNWKLLHRATGTAYWPSLTIVGNIPNAAATVGGTARHLVENCPATFKSSKEAWRRREVEPIIERIIGKQLGIKRFHWDDDFVRDLGAD